MYVPAHFAMSAEQVAEVLATAPAGDLVTVGPDGLMATYVPMLFDADAGGHGRLIGHLSRVNDQWRPAAAPGGVDALFIAHGAGDYVEADWLSTPEAPSVPTWNYVTVQVWGRLVVHDDAQRRARGRHRRHPADGGGGRPAPRGGRGGTPDHPGGRQGQDEPEQVPAGGPLGDRRPARGGGRGHRRLDGGVLAAAGAGQGRPPGRDPGAATGLSRGVSRDALPGR
ncbi:MAG: FMN-binding negative transcriptional regulator [Actinobacteria bacterium]|nr:FMN-binding negative transcriptional regulator [Actinomycetota bacterium]